MSLLSRAFRRPERLPAWATLDQEALRISAAMDHVEQHGNLDGFPGSQGEKVALMMTASRQGLVSWNREKERYDLTSLGREHLGMHRIPAAPPRPPRAPGAAPLPAWRRVNAGAFAAGLAGVVVGAAVMAGVAGFSGGKTPAQSKPPVSTAASVPAAAKAGIPCLAPRCFDAGDATSHARNESGAGNAASAPKTESNSGAPVPPPASAPPSQSAGTAETAVATAVADAAPAQAQRSQQTDLSAAGQASTSPAAQAPQQTDSSLAGGGETASAPDARSGSASDRRSRSERRRAAHRDTRESAAQSSANAASPPAASPPQVQSEPGTQQPGYAGADPTSSSRGRHAEQRKASRYERPRNESRRDREYADRDDGEFAKSPAVRRYEDQEGPPPFAPRRRWGDAGPPGPPRPQPFGARQHWNADEDAPAPARPGYARERAPFLFDFLFR